MKKGFLAVLTVTGLVLSSCSKEQIVPTNITAEEANTQLSYDPNDVNSILIAAGFSDLTTSEKGLGPGVKVVPGKWDGEFGDDIGCLPGSICYIEITPSKEGFIVIPTGNKPDKFKGRILPGQWTDVNPGGQAVIHYPYERF